MHNALRYATIDPVTEAQWKGAFACKFVPDEFTKREFDIKDGRKFHCKIARQSYLPLIAPAVVDHYIDDFDKVERESKEKDPLAKYRISFEMVVPVTALTTTVTSVDESSIAGGGSSGPSGLPSTVACPEYHTLGVLVDGILGKRDEYGVITFLFRLSLAPADNNSVLAFPVREADKALFLLLHQQQKGACMALFGSNTAFMKLAPEMQNQMDDAVRRTDARAFFYPKELIWQNGQQDAQRGAASAFSVGDLALFVFHKDGAHASRVVSIRLCPTLGHVLRTFVLCFSEMDESCINNQVACHVKYAAVLLTGVEPSLCTPTEFLRDSLCCPDFAVHITVSQSPGSTLPRGIAPQIDWKKFALQLRGIEGSP